MLKKFAKKYDLDYTDYTQIYVVKIGLRPESELTAHWFCKPQKDTELDN